MTLYRKYRPQTFADVVNQNPIKYTIQNQINKGLVPHAYLFTGPRGVGKTTMARLVAKAVNCDRKLSGSAEPCNQCLSCQEIQKGISLDLVEQDAASNRGIDEIRSMRDSTRFAPSKSRYKIFIIDEAHMLTAPAFNALLKTLEEPPAHIIFILATTEPHKLPETIISRCQRFDFKRVPQEEIVIFLETVANLEKVKIEQSILRTIAERAEGSMRDSLGMLGKIITLNVGDSGKSVDKKITWEEAELVMPRSDKELIYKLIDKVENGETASAVAFINHLIEEGVDIEQFALEAIDCIRERLIAAVLQSDKSSEIMAQSRFYRNMLDIFIKRCAEIQRVSFLPQLPLELAVIESCDILEGIEKHGGKAKERDKHLALEIVRQRWHEVLAGVKNCNHSLPVALSSSIPILVDGDRLVLGFKFKLHCQAVQSAQNQKILEDVLCQVFQQKLTVIGEVVENLDLTVKDQSNKSDSLVDDINQVFGEN